MSAGDCLAMPREIDRARRVSRLATALATWRAAQPAPVDDELSWILFGVGLATLQRIERGEVDPDGDVAARIAGVIGLATRVPPDSAGQPEPDLCYSDAPRPGRASASPAAATAGIPGAAASPFAAAPPRTVVRLAPALAKGDDGGFHVELYFGDTIVEQAIALAEQLANEILALVALSRDPDLYAKQPRLARPASEES